SWAAQGCRQTAAGRLQRRIPGQKEQSAQKAQGCKQDVCIRISIIFALV
uniref:Uncharacterized protein n=1 Tax=Triticum urartu TaxID=4572 RepID=A0A8R7QDT9_TRIUA